MNDGIRGNLQYRENKGGHAPVKHHFLIKSRPCELVRHTTTDGYEIAIE